MSDNQALGCVDDDLRRLIYQFFQCFRPLLTLRAVRGADHLRSFHVLFKPFKRFKEGPGYNSNIEECALLPYLIFDYNGSSEESFHGSLPPLSLIRLTKTSLLFQIKEYELSEVFHHAEDDRRYEVLKMERLNQNSINVLNGNSDIETAIEEEREEQEAHQTKNPNSRPLKQFALSTPYSTTLLPGYTLEQRPLHTISQRDESLVVTSSSMAAAVPPGDKSVAPNSIADSYPARKDHNKHKKYRKTRKGSPRKIRPPRDCRVTEWSQWGECSKSCGMGRCSGAARSPSTPGGAAASVRPWWRRSGAARRGPAARSTSA
ncbi:hypothetical protein NQ318_011135, partial [Aromia moschata]